MRAKTFQSTWRRSSPGEYARYSANSWLKPKSGERCRPLTNPSTTVFATRSRPEIPASTDGIEEALQHRRVVSLSLTLFHSFPIKILPIPYLRLRRRRHVFEQPPQNFIRIDAVRFGVEIQQDAVAQHRDRQRENVFVRDVVAAVRQRPRLGGQHDELRGAHAARRS